MTMAANADSARFPYQHLAVLGMDGVKKYLPPAPSEKPSASRGPSSRDESSSTRDADDK